MATNKIISWGTGYDINWPVYRWDNGGFDGYTKKTVQVEDRKTGKVTTIRGQRFSKKVRSADAVTQLVVHHSGGDGKDPSNMYETLWNQRGLSVHFAIEDDGRIYQFLDTSVEAWHAGSANGRSIGVECCLMPDAKANPDAYNEANNLKRKNLPHEIKEYEIQGVLRKCYMMPQPQVDALANLYALVWHSLGARKPPLFPRVGGQIPYHVIDNPASHVGLIGHFHLTANKWDPAGVDLEVLEAKVINAFDYYTRGE